ncbi:MAG: geranylgeranylglyceryl/heptaprenylglyceryl phosphate synthase, partial [Bacteroidota bacterium]
MRPSLQAQFNSLKQNQEKGLLILIDPDKPPQDLPAFLQKAEAVGGRAILVGGSLTLGTEIQQLIPAIKLATSRPVILFPGSSHQVTSTADGILLLSLISGRNPDLLIGRHVEAAPLIAAAGLEVLPTGYMLIEAG